MLVEGGQAGVIVMPSENLSTHALGRMTIANMGLGLNFSFHNTTQLKVCPTYTCCAKNALQLMLPQL